MLYVALLVGAVALLWAWRCSRAVKDLRERNERLGSRLNDLRLEMHRADEARQRTIAQLRFELMRQSGDLKVTGDMTVDAVTASHPQAAAVLAGFHIGGCASCAVDGSARLEEAVAENGGQLEPVLVALNILLAEGADTSIAEERLKMPNVQLA